MEKILNNPLKRMGRKVKLDRMMEAKRLLRSGLSIRQAAKVMKINHVSVFRWSKYADVELKKDA